jgi:hypothetical protein
MLVGQKKKKKNSAKTLHKNLPNDLATDTKSQMDRQTDEVFT